MKKQLLSLVTFAFLGLSNLLNAQAPNWAWAKGAGSSIFDEGRGVATDANGNVFITGTFVGPTITFGATTLTNSGAGDIFVVKYDANGNVVWAKGIGGTALDLGYSIATDASGNVFITGTFYSSSITFGTTTLTNAGTTSFGDIFITKYDGSGNVLWAKSAGGGSFDEGLSIATDASGNVIVTGWFQSPAITFGTTTLTNSGTANIFIVKYNAGGNVQWAQKAGGGSYDYGFGVSTDGSGNVFITGNFESSAIYFGATMLINSGMNDIFIAKYDASGNLLWANKSGGANVDFGTGICSNSNGNVIVTGFFSSPTITFGTTTLTKAGAEDVFIVKYDGSGNVIWAKSAGNYGSDFACSVATDVNGNAFVAGYFSSPSITFGTTTLTNANPNAYEDSFVVKYDANGNEIWAKSVGGANEEMAFGVATNINTNVFLTGRYSSPTLAFGTTTLTNAGGMDVYVAKLSGTTGIESAQNNDGFSVYPNPVTDLLIINYLSLAGKETTVSISDVAGKVIYQKTFAINVKMEVNTTDFAEGVYFVKMQNPDFISTQKVIVTK